MVASRKDVIATLQGVLRQEQKLGFQNDAVFGGLPDFWLARLSALEALFPDRIPLLQKLTRSMLNYDQADRDERRQSVSQVLFLLSSRRSAAESAYSVEAENGISDDFYPGHRPDGSVPPVQSADVSASNRPVSDADRPVVRLPGVGPANAQRLAKLGIASIRDLLYHFPLRHIDYRDVKLIKDLEAGQIQTVLGTVVTTEAKPVRRGRLLRICAVIADHSGRAQAVWFRARDYLSRELAPERTVVVSGLYQRQFGRAEFADPDWELPDGVETIHTARLVPVYPKVAGLGERWLRRLMKYTVDRYAEQIIDPLPESVRRARGLLDLSTAITQAHFPDSPDILARAQHRLAFDELIVIQLGVLQRRQQWREGAPGYAMPAGKALLETFLRSLPFEVTCAQRRVLDETMADLASGYPMSRLLQGEVGSGKTVVAAGAMLVAAANGYQAALMAPTEILAEQHYRTIAQLLKDVTVPLSGDGSDGDGRSLVTGLLTGSTRTIEKRRIAEQICAGQMDIVVGTHALIQEGVEFTRLGLAIVDEQHRFGVLQRTALRQKGGNPHLLVMTATPIPRTLALTLYGDLDISVIDELPPGRQEIKTKLFDPSQRHLVYEFVRQQVKAGRQVFVICPLVEESEKLEAKAATAEYERLSQEVLADLRVGLLHGRMRSDEKDSVMRAFQRGELDVLVSTAVVEVGIDVPNATVMVIEGADRFGLSQLHQFRGRVGRGTERSYCALLTESTSAETRARLQKVEQTGDGFTLAEEDLKLRGPGEFLGTRQSGLPDLKMARMAGVALLEEVRLTAAEILTRDGLLQWPEHRLLGEKVRAFWQGGDLI